MRPPHNAALRALRCSLFLDHFHPEFQGQVFPFPNAQLPPESRGISLLKDIEIQECSDGLSARAFPSFESEIARIKRHYPEGLSNYFSGLT